MSSGKQPSVSEYERYYGLLGLKPGATDKDVATAYRTQALRLHPDKNRADPRAQERFHELRAAYEIISDPEARRAYETLLEMRRDREERRDKLDAKRRAMQDDLLEREREVKRVQREREDAEAALQARMDRLREQAMRAEQEQRQAKDSEEISSRTLLISSSRSDGPEALASILKAYDPSVLVEPLRGPEFTAVFNDRSTAEMVLSLSRAGSLPSHLKMSWLLTGRNQQENETAPKVAQRPAVQLDGRMALPKEACMPGYEASVIDRLRNAHRKRQTNSS